MTRFATAALALVVGSGCHATLDRSRAPGREVTREVSEVPVRGYHVVVTTQTLEVRGELLAIDERTVWLLQQHGGPPLKVGRDRIRRVAVTLRQDHVAGYTVWTVLGGLSSAGLGWFGFGMGPLWGVTGSASATAEGVYDDVEVAPEDIDTLFQFARFPQGPPPMLDKDADELLAPSPYP